MSLNAAVVYQGSKINTASPAELTLMMYDGAIKFCNKAIYAIENKDIISRNLYLQKAQKIIVELKSTLDYKYSVSKDFERMYDYIYGCLVEGNVQQNKGLVEEALKYIRELRDTWKEVMKINKIFVQ